MFNNFSSPFSFFGGANNIFTSKKEKDEDFDYFFSQSTQNDSQNNLSEKKNKNIKDKVDNPNKSSEINIFIDPKLVGENPKINIIYLKNDTNKKRKDDNEYDEMKAKKNDNNKSWEKSDIKNKNLGCPVAACVEIKGFEGFNKKFGNMKMD